MKNDPDHQNPPRLELFAGYVDGELGPHDRATVEAWCRESAKHQAELEAQASTCRDNADFWQRTAIPAPSEAAFAGTLTAIRAALEPATPAYRTEVERPAAVAKSWRRAALGFAATAAALMAGIFLYPNTATIDHPGLTMTDDVLAVVQPNDVDILSVTGDDASAVLVGRAILTGPIEIVNVGDVSLDAIAMDPDGRPNKPGEIDPKKPMFVVPRERTQPVP